MSDVGLGRGKLFPRDDHGESEQGSEDQTDDSEERRQRRIVRRADVLPKRAIRQPQETERDRYRHDESQGQRHP